MAKVKYLKIKKIEKMMDYKKEYVYDMSIRDKKNPYFFANGILVHNTDSIFIQLTAKVNPVLDRINKEFIPNFLKEKYNITDENKMEVELKDVYDRMVLFGKKKKYILKLGNEFVIKGLDTEKYDVPKKIRVLMKEIIKKLFDAQSIDLEEYRKKIYELDLQDIKIIKRFNKKMEEYKSLPQHLRAYRWGLRYALVEDDRDKTNLVKMVFVKTTEDLGYSFTDITAIDDQLSELPFGIEVDYEKYFQFFLIKKMEDLYDVFGVEYKNEKKEVKSV